MFTESLKTQTPARLKALKFSLGITATASDAAHAHRLAQGIVKIRPGILQVGRCTVDLWRMSCSCSAMRERKLKNVLPAVKPCPHFLACYLAMEWTPADGDPTLYLRKMGIEQPKILATYARVKHLGKWQTVRIGQRSILNSWLAYALDDESPFLVWYENITRLAPFYE